MTVEEHSNTHLFVLVHGLWGGPNHMLTIEKSIRELLGRSSDSTRVATIRPSSFRFWKTYDGLLLNAERVVSDVLYEIEMIRHNQKSKVTQISFVGYSLGGLISRYAVGILQELGVFDQITPVFFTTFATPHVGVHFYNDTFFDKVANETGKYLFGKSGKEMFLADSDLTLRRMADPGEVWYQGLSRFEKHILLANIKNDRTVAFFTSYITQYLPFTDWDKVQVKYLKHLPKVRIGKVEVRPKFVDFTRTRLADTSRSTLVDTLNAQEETSFLRRNKTIRFLLIFLVTLFILPIWVPMVLSSSLFASAYSAAKIAIISHPPLKEHWQRVVESCYCNDEKPIDAEDAKVGQQKRQQRRTLRHSESFKGDTSEITENAMENFMYAEERLTGRSANIEEEKDDEDEGSTEPHVGYDDGDDMDEDEAAEHAHQDPAPASEADPLLTPQSAKLIDVDIAANDKCIEDHVSSLRVRDYAKFPLFTKSSILDVDEHRAYIVEQLNKLDWIKIPVYIDAWNAHDGIVARRGPRTNPKGTATILLWASILRRHLTEGRGDPVQGSS